MSHYPQAAASQSELGRRAGGPPPLPGAVAAEIVAPPPRPAWSAGQLSRMADEWRRLQRAFAYHPHVTVSPLAGDGTGGDDRTPPSAYQIDYRVQTLIVSPTTNQLEYAATAAFEVRLAAGFPNEAPSVRPLTPVFHPNVSYDGVSLDGLWHPNETLVGLVRKVGELLAYRAYDAAYAVNPAAVDWLTANHAHTPTDQQANLAPTAGGEPLNRIRAYGPQSLDSMKQSVLATHASLLTSAAAPDAAAVRAFADKTRLALKLFLEPDVPPALAAQATELERAAAEMAALVPAYGFARDRRRRTSALRQAVRQLAAAADPLAAQVAKLAVLADASGVVDGMAALNLIPESGVLQPVQFSLPKLAAEAQKSLAAVAAGRRALVDLPEPPLPEFTPPVGGVESLLGPRLAADRKAGAVDADAAAREAAEAQQTFGPAVSAALAEAEALDVAARWREYLDMATKAKTMERHVRAAKAEGLQAYYIANESGRFGPYQFEQSIDLGGGDLLVRSLGGKAFEVRDVLADAALATADGGDVVVSIPAPALPAEPAAAGGPPPLPRSFETRFALAERCDDLIVQLEFLRRSTIETVQRFGAYAGDAQTWVGQVCRLLASPDVRAAIQEELAQAARRWRYTIVDLAALGPWKERLATYFLVHRCAQEVPPLASAVYEAKRDHRASRKRLEQIISKSGRDHDTGALVIPPTLSRQYKEEVALQETTSETARLGTARLKSIVQQLMARLQNPKLLGKPTPPTLRVIPPLPDALAGLDLSDGTIANLVASMEQLLQVPLGGPSPEPHPQETQEAAAVAYPAPDGYAEGAEGIAAGEAEAGYAEGYVQKEAAGEHGEAVAAEPTADEHGDPAAEGASPEGSGADRPATEHAGHADSDGPQNEQEFTSAASNDWVVDDDSSHDPTEGHEPSDVVLGFEPEPPSTASLPKR